MERAWLARVTSVSSEADRPFWIKASWPAINGEHPDWIPPAPAGVWRTPLRGAVVQVEEVPGKTGRYRWRGEQPLAADSLPDEVKAAMDRVVALLPPHLTCYLVLDDRTGAAGGVRLVVSAGASVLVRNDGQVQIVPGTAKQVEVGGTGLLSTAGVVTGECNCAYTGAPHPVFSAVVRAKK